MDPRDRAWEPSSWLSAVLCSMNCSPSGSCMHTPLSRVNKQDESNVCQDCLGPCWKVVSGLVRSSGCCLLGRQDRYQLLATGCISKQAQHGRIDAYTSILTMPSDITFQCTLLYPRALSYHLFQEDLVHNMQAERVSNREHINVCPYFTLDMSLMTCIYVAWQLPVGHGACLLPKCMCLKFCRVHRTQNSNRFDQ